MESSEDIYKQKLKKLKDNQGWNNVLDKELVRYQQKAWCYKILHYNNASWYGTIDWLFTITALLTGMGSLIPNNESYIYIILTTISAGILGYQKMAGYSKLEQQHYTASNNYSKFVTATRNVLKLYRRDRPLAKNYIEFISTSYDDLVRYGLPIDDIAIYRFKKKYKNPTIFLPDILSDNIDVLESGIDDNENSNDGSPHSPKIICAVPEDDDSETSELPPQSDENIESLNNASTDARMTYEIRRFHASQNVYPNFN